MLERILSLSDPRFPTNQPGSFNDGSCALFSFYLARAFEHAGIGEEYLGDAATKRFSQINRDGRRERG